MVYSLGKIPAIEVNFTRTLINIYEESFQRDLDLTKLLLLNSGQIHDFQNSQTKYIKKFKMDIQEEQYQQPIESLDVSLDEEVQENEILEKIIQDSLENLLVSYQTLVTDKQKLESFKKTLSTISVEAKQNFYRQLWIKIVVFVDEAIEGKKSISLLKQSNLLELFILAETSIPNLSVEMYKKIHTALQNQTNTKNLNYLIKFLHKVGKHIDKRDQLSLQISQLFKNLKFNQLNDKFKITKKYFNAENDKLVEEKYCQMIFFINYLSFNDNHHLRIGQDEFRKIVSVLKDNPYTQLLDTILKNQSRTKKFTKMLINCDFKVVNGTGKYIYPENTLHPSLQTKQSYSKALQFLNERIFSQLKLDNFVLQNNQVFSKIGVDTLKKLSQNSKIEFGQYSNENLDEIIKVIKFLLANCDKKIGNSSPKLSQMIQQNTESEKQELVDQYLIYSWIIFTKYFYEYERSDLDLTFFTERVTIPFLKQILSKVLEIMESGRKQGQVFAEETVKIIVHLFYKNQYAGSANYTTEISKLVQKVLLKVKEFPRKWRNLRKLKALFDRWGDGLTEVPENFEMLINRFLNAFFDEKLRIKSRSYTSGEFFSNQPYIKFMGSQTSLKIQQLVGKTIEKLSSVTIFNPSAKKQEVNKINSILYKVSCLLMSRMKLPDAELIGNLLYKLYQSWGHEATFIYSFRTWIIQYSSESKQSKIALNIEKILDMIAPRMKDFESIIQKLSAEEIIKPFRITKQNEASVILGETISNLYNLVNNLELKNTTDSFSKDLFERIIAISKNLNTIIYQQRLKIIRSNSQGLKAIQNRSQLSSQKGLYTQLLRIYNNLLNVLKFYLFNLKRLLDKKDVFNLLQKFSDLLKELTKAENISEVNLKYINDLMGFNDTRDLENNLAKIQLNSQGNRGSVDPREQFFFAKQEYTPMIIISILYFKCKTEYSRIIKNLVQKVAVEKSKIAKLSYRINLNKEATIQIEEQTSKQRLHRQAQNILENIFLPSINIFSPSFFNLKFQQKSKEEQAYAILLDQFNILFDEKIKFTTTQIISLFSQIVGFLQSSRDKQRKVINKQVSQNQQQQQRPNRRLPLIMNELMLMGYEQEVIQLAIQHAGDEDPDNIINWLELNSHRVHQLLTSKVIERSRSEFNQTRKSEVDKSIQLKPVSYQDFKGEIQKGIKKIIKLCHPEVFNQHGMIIKDLLFACLDSYKDEKARNKNLSGFSQSNFKQLDKLNVEFSGKKLEIIVSTLTIIISKKNEIIKDIYEKCIPTKLLSLFHKADPITCDKILNFLNATLPVPNEKSSPAIIQYMKYLADTLLHNPTKSEWEVQIIFKMIKANNKQINDKVLKLLRQGISKGLLREKLFSILNIIFDKDQQISRATIELQIKKFIIENYSTAAKEKFIQVDGKKFSLYFHRYQENSFFIQTVKRLFVKKNGKLCYEIAKHNLYINETTNQSFINHKLPDHFKLLLQNLIQEIVNEKNNSFREGYIRELQKALQYYKILIPFCLNRPINKEGTTFIQWLMENEFSVLRGQIIHFISFAFLNNGLNLDENYSFSDYLTAKLMIKYTKSEDLQNSKWFKLCIIYLLHIKKFNEKTHFPIFSIDSQSLTSNLTFKQQILNQMNNLEPIKYTINVQILYLILKKQLIDGLSNNYKISDDDQKEFLNMDLFYTRQRNSRSGLSIVQQSQPNSRLLGLNRIFELVGDGREQDDMEALHFLRRMLIMRQRSSDIILGTSQNISSIFVPIQSQQSEQANQQQNQEKQAINEQKKDEPMKMQQQVEVVTRKVTSLQEIVHHFSKSFPTQLQVVVKKIENFDVKLPTEVIKKQEIQQSLKNKQFTVNIKEPKVIVEYRSTKLAIFRERIIQICEIIDPLKPFSFFEEKKSGNLRPDRNDRESYEGFRRQIIGRMMGDRERQNNNAPQVLNMNRLLGQIEQYKQVKIVQQIKKEQQKKPEKEKEQKKQKQQEKIEVNENLSANLISQQVVNIQQNAQSNEMVSEENIPNIQIQQEMIPQSQISSQNNPINQVSQLQNRINQQFQRLRHQQQQILQQIQSQPQQLMMEVPARQQQHRQVLAMLGLPQTFLQQVGIDAQSFDFLPEDMQIQQLTIIMQQNNYRPNAQNQTNSQNNNQGNQANSENQPNLGNNSANLLTQSELQLQNQNAAFISSLDPQLRAQTLMEATPQFLLTLPPAMRAQAQNYRNRHINQLIRQQQEIEYERASRPKPVKELVYPQLSQKNFDQIDDETGKKISNSILIKFPRFKIEGIKILLQNKKTQQKLITTLISYIKNIESLSFTECSFNKQENKWYHEEKNFDTYNRKIFIEDIFALIEDHITNCIYRDSKFLLQKYPYTSYSALQLPVNKNLRADQEGYYPLYELIDSALDNHYYPILTKMIKKCNNLPKKIRKKIVRGIRQDRFNDDFYTNLQNLSKDQKFKQAFANEFPEDKPIKIQTLSKVLKYQFSKLSYIKKLHVETLKKHKVNPPKQIFDFLNQIFSSYTENDIKQIQPLLIEHKQIHYHIIKYLYEAGKSLENQPIGLILKFPHLLDFETKRFIFQRNPNLHKSRHRCIIEVSRTNLFQQSFNQLMNKSVKQLQGSIKVVFIDEQAQDAGGPRKQWYLSLSKQIFDPRYALFEPSSSGNTYQPNPKSYVNSEHLSYFKFIGRFFAKALCEGMLIDAFFTRSFYKLILGHELELKDIQQQDYSFYKNLVWLKQNPLEDDEYTFSYTHDYFGKIITKELVPGGQNIKVTEQNKQEYIHKYIMAMMKDAIGPQISKFLQGFYEILPKDSITFFEPVELELLMSGMPTIDLKDLKLNTDYQGYSPNDPVIKWLWQILQEYTNQDLTKLVQFITGTSKIPLQGFSKLQGMHGPQKICIIKDSHINQLPKSHTCFNQLDLPNYPTKQILKQKLRVTLTWGSEGFGFM